MNPCNTQGVHGLWLLEKSPEESFLWFSNNIRFQEPEPPPILTWLPLLLPKRTGWECEDWVRGCPGTWQCNCCNTVNCSFWPLGLQIFVVNKSSYCISEMHLIILHDWLKNALLAGKTVEQYSFHLQSTFLKKLLRAASYKNIYTKFLNQLLTNQD